MNSPPDSEVLCIECGNPLPRSANKCAQCGSFQVPWKNGLKTFVAIAGGSSVVVAALSFIVGTWDSTRKVIAWHDRVSVIAVDAIIEPNGNYNNSVVIANTGDGDIVLLGLKYNTGSNGRSMSHDLFETLNTGKVTSQKDPEWLKNNSAHRFWILNKSVFGSCDIPFERFQTQDPCFPMQVFTTNNPTLVLISEDAKSTKDPLCSMPEEAVLTAFSLKSEKTFTTTFPVTMVLQYDHKNPKCRPPKVTANPSIERIDSGLWPPRSAHVKR